jgi:hypothetical protein
LRTTDLDLSGEEGNTPMPRYPMQAVAVTLVFTVSTLVLTMSSGRAEGPKHQVVKKLQGIRAEVKGTLHFESSRGYFISVKPADKPGQEMRVWLRPAEDKALVRKLERLVGKEVVASGNLAQMPENVQASVPPLGVYLRHGFEIEHAEAK